MMRLPEDIAERIYDVLVAHAGAPEQYRTPFLYTFCENEEHMLKPTEFRVCSKWGMAGKFWWNNKFYVSGRSRSECSSDHEHGIELLECDRVNVLLAPLYEEFEQRV